MPLLMLHKWPEEDFSSNSKFNLDDIVEVKRFGWNSRYNLDQKTFEGWYKWLNQWEYFDTIYQVVGTSHTPNNELVYKLDRLNWKGVSFGRTPNVVLWPFVIACEDYLADYYWYSHYS